MLKEVADKYNLVVVTEVISPEQVDLIKDYVDIYQVGTKTCKTIHF